MSTGKLIEGPETVFDVLKHMSPQPGGLPSLLGMMSESRKHFMELHQHGRALVHIDFAHQFIMIGSVAMGMMGDKYNATKFVELLWGKSQMYGDNPIRSWGVVGVVIRIDSKVLRLENLQKTAGSDTDDTIADILGYAVLGYRLVTMTKQGK